MIAFQDLFLHVFLFQWFLFVICVVLGLNCLFSPAVGSSDGCILTYGCCYLCLRLYKMWFLEIENKIDNHIWVKCMKVSQCEKIKNREDWLLRLRREKELSFESFLRGVCRYAWIFLFVLDNFVMCDPIDEGTKVRGEICACLLDDHIRYLKKLSLWYALPIEYKSFWDSIICGESSVSTARECFRIRKVLVVGWFI